VTWRFPRFTTLQLLLAAAFCALVVGLATASWRSGWLAQITAVGYSPGGKYLAVRYASGYIVVWDVSTPRPRRVSSMASSSAWAYDASGIHFADEDTLVDVLSRSNGTQVHGEFRTLDLTTGRVQKRFDYHGTSAGLLYAAAGDTVAIVEWPAGKLACYSLASGQLVHKIDVGTPTGSIYLTRDGRTLVAPDANGTIYVCDTSSGTLIYKQPATAESFTPAMSENRRWLAFIDRNQNYVRVHDLHSNTSADVLPGLNATWLAFTADGSRLAMASEKAAEVREEATGRRVGRVVFDREVSSPDWWPWTPTWRSYVGDSHFSITPDGQTLATFDGSSVHLWDTASGKRRTTLTNHARTLQAVMFTGLFVAWSAAWGIVSRRQWQRACARPASPAPIEVKLCWGLMMIGGLVALAAPIAVLLFFGPLVWPMVYLSLFTGICAMARGAARDPRGLVGITSLQMMNIVACDPVNFVLGTLARDLLNRPHVRQFLHQATARAN
jgi:WD40 repeat protein